jgi:hypothetical protein
MRPGFFIDAVDWENAIALLLGVRFYFLATRAFAGVHA